MPRCRRHRAHLSPEDWVSVDAEALSQTVLSGSVGVGILATHTATILTLRQSGGTVACGSGVTLTTIEKAGGSLAIESSTTSIANDDGDLTINGSGTHAAITAGGGTVYYNSSGTCTAYVGSGQSFLDCDQKNTPATFTDITLHDGARFSDVNRKITHTNPITCYGPIGNRIAARRQYRVTPV